MEDNEEYRISKLEIVLIIGIIISLLFATWELGNLMVNKWFKDWVRSNRFINSRIILYGIAFLMSILSLISTVFITNKKNRFILTLNRAFLWYGTILLLSTIGFFIFDCLPEVIAGFLGAVIFGLALFILQKKYYTKERLKRIKLSRDICYSCGKKMHPKSIYCSSCKIEVGIICEKCSSINKVIDKYCYNCGSELVENITKS